MPKYSHLVALVLVCGATACVATAPTTDRSDQIAGFAQRAYEQVLADPSLPTSEQILAGSELARALASNANPAAAQALLDSLFTHAMQNASAASQAAQLIEVLAAQLDVNDSTDILARLRQTTDLALQSEDADKRADLVAKLAVLFTRAGDNSQAKQLVDGIPTDSYASASYKARALHDIGPELAARGDIDGAEASLIAIDSGITYYQASGRADVAVYAVNAGQTDVAKRLLSEAGVIAREQHNGYFIGGALRRISDAYFDIGDPVRSGALMVDAIAGARTAPKLQEQARALSRIATTLADQGNYLQARQILPEAIELATRVKQDNLRAWCFYEIAGAAAFAGDDATAATLLIRIPEDILFGGKSPRAAAERDVAWGLARNGRVDAAVARALAITNKREQAQALSRIVQVLNNPSMKALPRYL